jgi:ABC-type transporter Mla subunit MlaD
VSRETQIGLIVAMVVAGALALAMALVVWQQDGEVKGTVAGVVLLASAGLLSFGRVKKWED